MKCSNYLFCNIKETENANALLFISPDSVALHPGYAAHKYLGIFLDEIFEAQNKQNLQLINNILGRPTLQHMLHH